MFRNLTQSVTWCRMLVYLRKYSLPWCFSFISILLNFIFHQIRVFPHSCFEIFRITAFFYSSSCSKFSPDHMTMTSHPKWRLTVNFFQNSHSISEYNLFTPSFTLFYIFSVYCIFRAVVRGHGGRVVTLSPPTSAAGVRSLSWP